MKRKGYTIVEIAIALGISGVIFASIVTMVVSVSSFSRIRNESAAINEELVLTKTRLINWFDEFDDTTTPAPSVSEDGSVLAFGDDTAFFNDGTLTLSGEEYNASQLDSIVFELPGDDIGYSESIQNLVKCTVTYTLKEAGGTYTFDFLLLKRSMGM